MLYTTVVECFAVRLAREELEHRADVIGILSDLLENAVHSHTGRKTRTVIASNLVAFSCPDCKLENFTAISPCVCASRRAISCRRGEIRQTDAYDALSDFASGFVRFAAVGTDELYRMVHRPEAHAHGAYRRRHRRCANGGGA